MLNRAYILLNFLIASFLLGCTPEELTGEIDESAQISSELPVISSVCQGYSGGINFNCNLTASHPQLKYFQWSEVSNTCSYLSFDSSTGNISGSPPKGATESSCQIQVSLSFQGIQQNHTINLQQRACPSGYVLVPGNDLYSTNDFCMMKFEAKDAGGGVPTSVAAGVPYEAPNSNDAYTACDNLNQSGQDGVYAITSNMEWMSAAANIESENSNWSGIGGVGDGTLNRGHSDNSPASALAVTDEADSYVGTGNSAGSGWEQKRTHHFTNGNTIWDMGGNAWEAVDWDASDSVFTLGPTDEPSSWVELSVAPSGGTLLPIHYRSPLGYDNSENTGRKHGGGGGVTSRGAGYYLTTRVGVFSIGFLGQITDSTSFRCVYRFTE